MSLRFIRRAAAWIFALTFLYAVLFIEDQPPRTPRMPEGVPEGEVGRDLPAPDFNDPGISIVIENQVEPSLGSGFSVHASGVYLTARHVVDSCKAVAVVQDGESPVAAFRASVHPSADVAVLSVRVGAPPLRLSSETLEFGQKGAHFGFPQGHPRQVESTLIGRRHMYTQGRYRIREPVVAWSENVRIPEFRGTLGGISGGMVLNESGEVVGVTVASSIRRGRIFTADPSSLVEALRIGQRTAARNGTVTFEDDAFDRRNLKSTGRKLRRSGTLVRVLCLVDPLRGQ